MNWFQAKVARAKVLAKKKKLQKKKKKKLPKAII
jgi:hypothetical protein